jgi:peptide/nickel transport system permease protein
MTEITYRSKLPSSQLTHKRGALQSFAVRLFRENPLGAFGAVVCLIFLFVAIFADLLAPYGFNQIMPSNRLKPPSWQFWFGTDQFGRDVFSRVLYGARLSITVGLTASLLATIISVVIGITTGYLGGKTDMVAQRFVDAWMSFPDIVVLIVVVAIVGTGMPQIILVLGCLYGVAGSRIIRGAVLSAREQAFIHAAQSIGGSNTRVIWRHILPNVMPPIIVLFTMRVGSVILVESALSFLGMGVPPPTPTWGSMLTGSARAYMYLAPWMAIAPGLCLTIVVFSVNMFGDALRDLLDPRMSGTR